jgi:hypothetical protein
MRNRSFEPVDMAIVSGALLTVFGAALLWVATQGRFQMTSPMEPNPEIAKTTLEEEMGRSVVMASVIEDKHSKAIARAARKLNAETLEAEQLNKSGNDAVQQVLNEHLQQEQRKAARIEFIKGQSIVNATLRAKRTRQLPEDQWKVLNQRAITSAANESNRIERAFRINAPQTLNAALENRRTCIQPCGGEAKKRPGLRSSRPAWWNGNMTVLQPKSKNNSDRWYRGRQPLTCFDQHDGLL